MEVHILISFMVKVIVIILLSITGKIEYKYAFRYCPIFILYQEFNPNARFMPIHRRIPWLLKREEKA